MGIIHGWGASLAFGKESTWATPVTFLDARPGMQMGLRRNFPLTRRPNYVGRGGSATGRKFDLLREEAGGPFRVEASYQGIGYLLEHFLGNSSSAGGGPYTHTYKLAKAPLGSLTCRQILGFDEDGNGFQEDFAGCKISKMSLIFPREGAATLEGDILAKTASARAAAVNPTIGTEDTILLPNDGGTLSWNSRTVNLKELRLVMDRRMQRRYQFGANTIIEPLSQYPIGITLRGVFEYVDNNLYNDAIAGTEDAATCVFTGAGNSQLTITAHRAKLKPLSMSDTPNVREKTFEFEVFSDGTDEGIELEIINDQASAIAA